MSNLADAWRALANIGLRMIEKLFAGHHRPRAQDNRIMQSRAKLTNALGRFFSFLFRSCARSALAGEWARIRCPLIVHYKVQFDCSQMRPIFHVPNNDVFSAFY